MTDSLDRRQFLGRTAVAGSAAGLAVGAGTACAKKAAERRVVIGIMGLSRGRALAAGFARHPGVEIKYLCDVDKNRAASASSSINKLTKKNAKVVYDFRRILDDPEVDLRNALKRRSPCRSP